LPDQSALAAAVLAIRADLVVASGIFTRKILHRLGGFENDQDVWLQGVSDRLHRLQRIRVGMHRAGK
jgi:hypothetical protein